MPDNPAPPESKQCPKKDILPVAFEEVLQAELKQIGESRKAREVRTSKPPGDTLIGLAFSGGGIRSATFNLGILQALARKDLLSKFDYLSTVSGGGYIGSWLAALTHRLRDQGGFPAVVKILKNKTYEIGQPAEERAVRWLRNYSDYLTPRTGIFTGDAGAVAGNWLRNVLLNQWVLVLFLLGLILLPSFVVLCTWDLVSQHFEIMFSIGVALLAVGTVIMSLSMGDFVPWAEQRERIWIRRKRVQLCIALFFVAACLMNGSMWTWPGIADGTLWYWVPGGAAFYFLVWLLAFVIAKAMGRKPPPGQSEEKMFSWPTLLLAAVGSGMLGGLLLNRHAWFLAQFPRNDTNAWPVIIFGTVGLMLLMQLVAVLQLGLLGNGCMDLVREWWARAGGRLILIMLVWVTTFGIVIFGPLLVLLLLNTPYGKSLNGSALLAWLASIAGGIGAGKSAKTSGQSKPQDGVKSKIMEWLTSPKMMEVVAKVAPYVFAAGLLVLLSTAVHYVAGLYLVPEKTRALWTTVLSPIQVWRGYWAIQSSANWLCVLLFAVCLIAAAVILSWRVDVNDFSMHHFYRNRLVRCYLGASNQNRKPQSFTGFDPDDEIALADLVRRDSNSAPSSQPYYPGLYPILNGTLNVTRGGELGFQKRKAKPFVFTPLYCGYDVGSYQPTECGRSDKLGHTKGLMLGTAMAISGAAVSPNMGYHTSPATAFFLTLFDVRLGWWMGNPQMPKRWKSPGPPLGLAYLLSELLGSSDESSGYVYLSDGAHFENLAIYELIERRCRLILACDCGEDGGYGFGDLMSAIEKARTDFGVDIRIDVSKIKPVFPARESENNYAVAKIHYGPNKDDCGILIYVKASLPKDVPGASPEHRTPSDVVSYAQAHQCFPHQSTGDQWFDEVQFESYRALGEYIGASVANDTGLDQRITDVLAGVATPCDEPKTAPPGDGKT